MISADVAKWIRDVVLPAAYRAASTDPGRCPCQWGVCGHCRAARHHLCAAPTGHGPSPDTYITTAGGLVTHAPDVPSARVWRAGRPCRWVCTCTDCPGAVLVEVPLW